MNIKRVFKRFICLLIALAIVFTYSFIEPMVAYGATLSHGINGLDASYDKGSWTVSGTTFSGTATGSAGGGCSSASATTSTLTLKNTSGSPAKLSFAYDKPTLGSGGSVTINGTSVNAAGTFAIDLANNASITVVIVSGIAGAYTSSIVLNNVAITVQKTVTTTFKPPQGSGSYTVNGEVITSTKTDTRLSTDGYTLVATKGTGYKFEGWYSETLDKFLSSSATYNAYFDSDQTIYPVFIPEDTPVWEVGAKWFTDLNDAITYATSSNTSKIVLISNGTLASGIYTIPSGKTVLIPYDVAKTVSTTKPDIFKAVYTNTLPKPSAYSVLTMADGASILVNGSINVNAKVNSTNNAYTGVTCKEYGWIKMNSGSSITLNSNSNLYCYGYITGDGIITAKNNSTVYEPLQICDIRGGQATTNINGDSTHRVLHFSQYYVQNIEAELRLEYGSTEYAVGTATVQNVTETPSPKFISPSGGIFNLTSGGPFIKKYDPVKDRITYTITGNASVNSISLDVGVSIDTSKRVLPIMENTSIELVSGTLTINQDICTIPGSEFKIGPEATVKIASGKNIYVYDRDEWVGGQFIYPAVDLVTTYHSPTRLDANKFSTAKMVDTIIDINGTVDATGSFYTTLSGADIISSEGSGKVVFTTKPTASTTTYQAVQTGSDIAYTSITANAAWLHNGSQYAGTSEEYTKTAGSSAGTTYFYCSTHDKWESGTSYTVTLDPNGGNGTAITLNFCPNGGNLPLNTFVRDNYDFAGWNTKDDGTGTAYADGATITPTSNITLYAQWTEHTYTLEDPTYVWAPDNSTCTATAECVEDPTRTKTETVNTTYEDTTPATCETAGARTYTAVFEDEIFTMQTKTVDIPATGHAYGAPTYQWAADNSTVTATRVCANDSSHTETETVAATSVVTTPATCENAGVETFTSAAFENTAFTVQTKDVAIPATGHNYGAATYVWAGDNSSVTATRVCANDSSHIETETVNTTSAVTTEATCEGKGVTTYTATFTNTAFAVQTKGVENIPALGHNYCAPTYTWANDNSSVTATMVCSHDASHVITETVQTTSNTTPAGCETDGSTIYTANFENPRFETQTKNVVIPAIGHKYGTPTYEWASDNSSVTATVVCTNDSSHVITETVDTTSMTTPATCEADGSTVYRVHFANVLFQNQERTVPIAALGHDLIHHDAQAATCTEAGWKAYDTCSRCDYTTYEEIEALGHDLIHHDAQAATCTEHGWEAYDTCSRCDYTTYEEIAALGHDLVHHDAQAATCTEIGWNAYDTCSRCDYTTYEEIEALGHDLIHHDAQAATCTEHGWEAYDTCSRCDYTTYVEIPAKGHTPGETVQENVEGATCTAVGSYDEVVYCTTCGAELEREHKTTEALGHAWDEGKITTEPTCTVEGEKTFTCTRCGETKTEAVEALGHDLIHHDAQAATCTEHGWEAYDTCSRCDYTTYEEIEALGHDYVHHDAQAATCTEKGWNAYDTCSRCDYTTYVEIPAKGHTPGEAVIENAVAATCTEAGYYDEVVYCTVCGAELEREHKTTEALGHTLTATPAVAPTCKEAGNSAYWTCSVCGKYFSDAQGTTEIEENSWVIPAKGHTWNEGEITTEPTCIEAGVKTFTCSVCDATRTESVAALGHNLTHTAAADATCTEAGNIEHWTCDRCGNHFSDAEATTVILATSIVIPAKGHTPGEAVHENVVGATCTEAGTYDEVVYCKVCGAELEREHKTTEALGHAWDEGVVTTEPTCTVEGVKTFTCTRCGETKTEAVEALGHDLIHHDAQAATCTEIGWNAYDTCSRCDYTTYEEIAALGHAWDEGVVTTEPTCTEAGVKTFTCERCDATRTEEVAALGHDLKATAAKDPTCTEAGNIAYWTCDRCHEIFSDAEGKTEITLEDTVIKALGHAWDEGVVTTQPNCTEAGVKTFTCQRCDATRTEEVAALGHDLKATAAKNPTCTEAGNSAYWTCERCGKFFSDAEGKNEITLEDTVIPAAGHKWNEGEITTEPTCAEEGVKTFTCTVCGETRTETVAALGHNLTKTEAKAATCTEAGNSEYWTCERCGKFFSDAEGKNEITLENTVLAATGHKYGEPTYEWSADKATVTATAVCENDPTHVVTETVETTSAVTTRATCEETGVRTYTAEFENELFATQTDTEVIPATGHKYGEPSYEWSADKATVTATAVCENDPTHVETETVETTSAVTTPATCEGTGVRTYTAEFENELFATQTDTEVIPATGHRYGEPTYTWAEDKTTVTATAVCANDETHVVTETVEATSAVTTPATCEETGVRTYTAEFENELFATQTETEVIPALGHKYGEPTYEWSADKSTVTATAVCANDETHVVTETVETTSAVTTPATCEGTGVRTYTAEFENELFATQTETEVIPALGHNYGEPTYTWAEDKTTVTATAVCENDPTHVETETVETTSAVTIPATCEGTGVRTYTAEFENELFTTQTDTEVIPALGHNYGEPTYTWAEDKSTVTATAVCENDPNHVVTETVETTSAVTTPATCEGTGVRTYTAEFENELFTTQTETEVITATGHKYGEPTYEWSADKATVTATAICENDESHVVTETVETTSAVTTPATCEGTGVRTYTAKFENELFTTQTDTVVIPVLGHKYGEPTYEWSTDKSTVTATAVCENDQNHVVTETVETISAVTTPATCEGTGVRTYTAEFENELFTTQTDTEVIPALGHNYGEPTYTWAEDKATVTATAVCENDPTHVETETVKTTSAVTTPATCEGTGVRTYTAEFKNELFATQTDTEVIPATGHTWDEGKITSEPTCTETGVKTFTCTVCGETRTETVAALGHDLTKTEAKAATCTEAGNSVYWTCDRCGQHFSDEECTTAIAVDSWIIPAIGHDYGEPTYTWSDDNSKVAAVAICKHNPGHIVTEEVNTTFEDTVVATCEGAGTRVYTATFTKEQFATQTRTVEMPAIGHDYGKPTYTWADDKSTATATAVCKNDPTHVVTETVNTTSQTTAATCETAGSTVYTADFANVLFEEQTTTVTIPATGHDYGEPTYTWADDKSTVTATAVCKNDHAHVVTETVNTTKDVVPATCEQAGSTTYTAEFESDMFETQTLVLDTPAIGHLYGEPTYTWSDDKTSCVAQAICKNDATHVLTETATATSDVTTEPTCETAGERTYTAEFENSKFETQTIKEVIPANGHTLVATAAVVPTCTEAGNSAYWTCSVCGKHFSDAEGTTEIAADSWILPAKGHTLVATAAVAPSCTEAGNSAYWTCSVCGKHFSDAEGTTEIAADSWIIPAAGHIWDNGQVVTPATCTAEGQMLYTCTVCGTTRTEVIAKLPHTIREVAAVAPTCTLPGNSTYYVCDSCGHFFSDAEGTTEIAQDSWVIQANGHTWGEWVVITAPDCVNQGSEQRTCTVCGATESQNLDPNGHTWDEEFTVDQEPTCTTDGSKSKHCQFCDQRTEVTVIPALGHDWDTENVVFTWSDDLSEAEATFTCKRDHTHVETLKAAVTTETAAGIITYTATVVFEDATYTDTKTADAHEVIRIFGQNRYETCIKIADYYLERNKVDKLPAVVLATGKDFPDALTGAYLANVNHAPIMLIDSTSQTVITTYIKNHLASNGTVYVLGGTGAVDDSWIADLSGYNVKRMDGLNRFETNLSILKESGVKGGDIFVCTGLNYADSLSASGIDMPILIVGASLREDQKAYLAGGTWNFHLVGGDTVVTTDVENQLKAYGTIADRTYGSDRFATSKAMAEKFVGETHEAVLAYGANFPDGLCGGPLAYTMGSPIILSGSTPAQNTSGIAYTTGKSISSGLVLGGPALIDDQTVRTTFSMRESDQIKIYEE